MENKVTNIGAIIADRMKSGITLVDPMAERAAAEERAQREFDKAFFVGKAMFAGDFYIEIRTKMERALQNTPHRYYAAREACPRPEYDQVIYKYENKKNKLEKVWCIPDKNTTIMGLLYPTKPADLEEGEAEEMRDIRLFADGTLMRMSTHLNSLITKSTYRSTFKATDFKDIDNLVTS